MSRLPFRTSRKPRIDASAQNASYGLANARNPPTTYMIPSAMWPISSWDAPRRSSPRQSCDEEHDAEEGPDRRDRRGVEPKHDQPNDQPGDPSDEEQPPTPVMAPNIEVSCVRRVITQLPHSPPEPFTSNATGSPVGESRARPTPFGVSERAVPAAIGKVGHRTGDERQPIGDHPIGQSCKHSLGAADAGQPEGRCQSRLDEPQPPGSDRDDP